MDILPSGNIFQELQVVHETGYLSAQLSLEDKWQQVRNEQASAADDAAEGSRFNGQVMFCQQSLDMVWLWADWRWVGMRVWVPVRRRAAVEMKQHISSGGGGGWTLTWNPK